MDLYAKAFAALCALLALLIVLVIASLICHAKEWHTCESILSYATNLDLATMMALIILVALY